jgi:hypothetical protein
MTPHIQRFIDEYLIDGNGAAAARRAGYAPAGAKQRACVLLKRPDVQAAIAARKPASHAMSTDEIIAILSRIARGAAGEWQQLRALGMLMRHLGLFTPAKPPPEPTLLDLLQAMPTHPPEPQLPAPETSTAGTPPSRDDKEYPHPWDPHDPQPTPGPSGDEPPDDQSHTEAPHRDEPPRGRSNSGTSPRRKNRPPPPLYRQQPAPRHPPATVTDDPRSG